MAPPEGGSENTIIDQEANSEFRWGVKRGRGAKGKDIQFYDSFTYGGVEYSCYDCVYLHMEGEPEPYIGKIIKIWEDRKFKKNRIKLMWFFRPIEIRNWLDGHCPDDKEIFLASGEGKGVYNINLLEVIVGKCKAICTSTDPRNPKPSEEDLNNADYFYNRTFDVGKLMVSESFAGIEAEVAFNKQAYFGTNEFRANKSMANGSLFLEDGAKPGISGELSKRKLDKITNEEELKKDMISKKRPNNNETQKEKNMTLKEEVQGNATRKEDPKEELKGNEIPNEELKKTETARDDLKNEAAKEEMKKNESMKEELKKNEIAKEETEKNASPNDQRKKSETANEELIAEPEIILKVSSNLDSPIQFPRLEVKSSERKTNKNEPSKEEKKPIKRARVMVDSDEEADGMTGFQMDESENAPRKITASKKELSAPENKVVKKAKLGDNFNKTSEEMAKTTTQLMELSKEKKLGREVIEITRRPEVESNKWFKGLPWDERLQKGFEQRAVIRIQNFDPSYTSSEIDDVMWHMFEERCTSRVMPRTMFSNPKSGDALVIFKTKEAAEVALRKLNQACLTFSDGRSFIATRAAPVTSGKQKYAGHICVEKHKLLMQRAHQSEDMRKAVSTSHCSQPNTIEYEMAMEWRLLQEKSERWWNGLYKQEASEVNKVEHKNPISKKKN